MEDTLILFDLTNFYFEGRKTKSSIAKFGRSKEKRYDCKITVLALCINKAGFVRYSEILEGNTADPDALPGMVEKLVLRTGQKTRSLFSTLESRRKRTSRLSRRKATIICA